MILGSGRFGIDYLLTKKNIKMKIILYIVATLFLYLTISCVQKTKKRVVIYTVDISKMDSIKKVGLRGGDSPLSWQNDYPMKEISKDSLIK